MTSDEDTTDSKKSHGESQKFPADLDRALEQSEREVRKITKQGTPGADDSLTIARAQITTFDPVPQPIWRMVNFAIGRSGKINTLAEGMVFGFKKLILNIAKDPTLGGGAGATTVRAALGAVSSDVIVATAVIHAVTRKLHAREFKTVWGPILDDAILRAHIGFHAGARSRQFGSGRGMLAGFSGRVGLAILIAMGTGEQAQTAITNLSSGKSISDVARDTYRCDPLHVSAMLLSAVGCGSDATIGIGSYAAKDRLQLNEDQQGWLSALTITELARKGELPPEGSEDWEILGFKSLDDIEKFTLTATKIKRRGHGWSWLM